METITESKLSEIIRQLMFHKNIRATELARLTKVPQPTIHRLVTGTSSNPHRSSLEPIAKFFSVSIEQLKGIKPIPWLGKEFSSTYINEVPLISWADVINWPDNRDEVQIVNKIFTDAQVQQNGFALKMLDSSMEPIFPTDTILVIDPDKEPKDRSYVVYYLHEQNRVVFRQILIDAMTYYLKPLSPDLNQFAMTLISDLDEYKGMLVQAKLNYS